MTAERAADILDPERAERFAGEKDIVQVDEACRKAVAVLRIAAEIGKLPDELREAERLARLGVDMTGNVAAIEKAGKILRRLAEAAE